MQCISLFSIVQWQYFDNICLLSHFIVIRLRLGHKLKLVFSHFNLFHAFLDVILAEGDELISWKILAINAHYHLCNFIVSSSPDVIKGINKIHIQNVTILCSNIMFVTMNAHTISLFSCLLPAIRTRQIIVLEICSDWVHKTYDFRPHSITFILLDIAVELLKVCDCCLTRSFLTRVKCCKRDMLHVFYKTTQAMLFEFSEVNIWLESVLFCPVIFCN